MKHDADEDAAVIDLSEVPPGLRARALERVRVLDRGTAYEGLRPGDWMRLKVKRGDDE